MDNYITIFSKYWGNLFLDYSINKLDILPRLSVSVVSFAHPRGFMFQLGFLFFTLQLTLWTKPMRDMLKKES